MKTLLTGILLLLSHVVFSQIITQTYIDPCDGMQYTVTFPMTGLGVYVLVRNEAKLFTYQQFQNGEVDAWIKIIFSKPCTLSVTTMTQSLQSAVGQSVSQISPNSSQAIETDSKNGSSSSSESKAKSGSKKSKEGVGNPTIISSDLTVAQSSSWNAILNVGISRASMVGDESYSGNLMIWSNLRQYALTTGYSKTIIGNGKPIGNNLFSNTILFTNGRFIIIPNYTRMYIDKRYGAYGFNFGLVLNRIYSRINYSSSLLFFWSNSYRYNKKLIINPQIFLNSPGITYITGNRPYDINTKFGIVPGVSIDYKLSRRFGFLLTYRGIVNIDNGVKMYNNFLLGSKMML
jgi:hypothetical protein